MLTALSMVCLFAQSKEQRQKANEFKCSFSAKLLSQNGTRLEHWRTDYGSYDKSKKRGQSYQYSIRLNSSTQETFTVETYFMAANGQKTYACASNSMDIVLNRGFTTNVVVNSPLIYSRKAEYKALGYREKEGGKIVGIIGRLKKDNVIIKTYCTMSPWNKISWEEIIPIDNGIIEEFKHR